MLYFTSQGLRSGMLRVETMVENCSADLPESYSEYNKIISMLFRYGLPVPLNRRA